MIRIRRSFHLKLALSIIGSVMVLISLSSTVTYWKFQEIMSRRVIGDFNQLMLQNAMNIDNMINSLDHATLLLYTDQTIMNILNAHPGAYMDTYTNVNRLNNEMTKYLFVPLTSSMNVSSISFFVSPDMPFAGALTAGSQMLFGFFNGREAAASPWYRQSVEADGRLIWFRLDEQPDQLFVARLLKNPEALAAENVLSDKKIIQNVGVVVIGFKLSEIGKQLAASELSPSTQLTLTDGAGNAIYSNGADAPGVRTAADRPLASKNDIVSRNRLLFYWQLTGAIPKAEIYKKSTVVRFIVGLSALIALIAGGLLAVFVSRRISLPIRRLARTMKAILTADPTNATKDPVPYKGIQFVAIPEFQGIGTTVGQAIASILAGQQTEDAALSAAQDDVTQTMQQAGYIQ